MVSITMKAAREVVEKNLPGAKVISEISHEDKYLFLAHLNDPFEGGIDPFFSVDKASGEFRDFSPQDYPNPLEVITKLQRAAT